MKLSELINKLVLITKDDKQKLDYDVYFDDLESFPKEIITLYVDEKEKEVSLL